MVGGRGDTVLFLSSFPLQTPTDSATGPIRPLSPASLPLPLPFSVTVILSVDGRLDAFALTLYCGLSTVLLFSSFLSSLVGFLVSPLQTHGSPGSFKAGLYV